MAEPQDNITLRRALRQVLMDYEQNTSVLPQMVLLAALPESPNKLQKSLIQAAIANELSPAAFSRLLRQAGYTPNLVSLVERLLSRFSEADESAPEVTTKDLMTLVDQADPTLVALQRARQRKSPEDALEGAISALLRGYGVDELSPAALSRLLRQAGYTPNLVSLVERLLSRFSEADESASEVTTKDLMTLVDQADPTLVALQRARQRKSPEEALQGAISALLRGYGVDATAAADLAVGVHRSQAKGMFRDLARISRAAQSAEDSCVSMADVSWRGNKRFDAAYQEAKSISAWGREITWRVQTLIKMAHLASQKDGHFVECGVDTGGTAMAVMSYLGDKAFKGRKFYLFDTFRGLEQSQLTEEELQTSLIQEARYPNVLEQVQATFADKAYAEIIPGPVPDTLAQYQGGAVAYLHIDMNVALPEVEALRFFWPKLSPGAPVIFDDYGFPHHEPQRHALDALAAEFGAEIMMLPTCQGLLFKT